ncbi:slipin family protein [Streptomyces tsukubensis]|uniref:Band 7 domain-containing protein n=1 Tax=Streptomyces tsukubensis TaxID=83656 RepID=A0A1V4AEF1_9ACTN|nr:slipin family protein [Streptomyces tsukubensis]OON82355.1 hypothetical protein B1H18_04895 [Streptomyces tsukubensis]QFR92850.1 slipin family protein [Streptomyces tsukubensis]
MGEELITAGVTVASAAVVYTLAAARVIKQYERGVVFRLGKLLPAARGPGFTMIVPFVDRLRKVNMQIVTMPVPAQDGITRDNVSVRVDAVIYFKVIDASEAVVRVEDYRFAVSQMAQTSLRSIIGKSDLDDLLSNREQLNQGLELMLDSPAVGWGVSIDRVEIKDVSLPETMKRSMARQAEADRDRRARVINADAELQASQKLSEAAQQMAATPSALQLRLLQTITAVAAEKNSTLVLPFPVELLRFLERAGQPAPAPGAEQEPAAVRDSAPTSPAPAPAPSAAPEVVAPGAPDAEAVAPATRAEAIEAAKAAGLASPGAAGVAGAAAEPNAPAAPPASDAEEPDGRQDPMVSGFEGARTRQD